MFYIGMMYYLNGEADYPYNTPGRRQSETLILSTNVDQKSLETEFSIAICRLIGDKWQSKTQFLAIFDPRCSIVKSVFDCRLPGVYNKMFQNRHPRRHLIWVFNDSDGYTQCILIHAFFSL